MWEKRELQRSKLKRPVLLPTSTYLPVLKLQWLKSLEVKNKVSVRQSKSEQTFDSFTVRARQKFGFRAYQGGGSLLNTPGFQLKPLKGYALEVGANQQ